jgi:hypothetical protein
VTIFERPLLVELPLDKENQSGYSRAIEFTENLINGGWPEELNGAWINFITVDEEINEFEEKKYQIIAVYFNDFYPSNTIIESSSPILNNYPEQYPDAYITWGTIEWQIWEIYVKPGLRRAHVGATLSSMAAVYAAQNGRVIQRPSISTPDAIQLMQFMEWYYADASPYPEIISPTNRVYTPFEEARLDYVDQIFGEINE